MEIHKSVFAVAVATSVALSGTAVADAADLPGSSSNAAVVDQEGAGTATPEKEASSSSDFGEVFGSMVTDPKTGETYFQFEQAISALGNIAKLGTAVVGVLTVIAAVGAKLPEVLEIFGVGSAADAE